MQTSIIIYIYYIFDCARQEQSLCQTECQNDRLPDRLPVETPTRMTEIYARYNVWNVAGWYDSLPQMELLRRGYLMMIIFFCVCACAAAFRTNDSSSMLHAHHFAPSWSSWLSCVPRLALILTYFSAIFCGVCLVVYLSFLLVSSTNGFRLYTKKPIPSLWTRFFFTICQLSAVTLKMMLNLRRGVNGCVQRTIILWAPVSSACSWCHLVSISSYRQLAQRRRIPAGIVRCLCHRSSTFFLSYPRAPRKIAIIGGTLSAETFWNSYIFFVDVITFIKTVSAQHMFHFLLTVSHFYDQTFFSKHSLSRRPVASICQMPYLVLSFLRAVWEPCCFVETRWRW